MRGDKAVLYFMHVHKAGGTTFCHLAHLNQLAVDSRFNCGPGSDSVSFSDLPRKVASTLTFCKVSSQFVLMFAFDFFFLRKGGCKVDRELTNAILGSTATTQA